MMGALSRFVVVLAALALLIVLITPAPDELPCTAGHKSPVFGAMFTNAPLPLISNVSKDPHSVLGLNRMPVVEDLRYLTCTFLC
jgi:hypothetical protein